MSDAAARPWWPVKGGRPHPMCTVADWIGGEECLRVAQWRIDPPDEHPVFLCNFHVEPFVTSSDGVPATQA